MPRFDRDLDGKTTQRASQHKILQATVRDDIGRTKPTDVPSDMDWNDREPPSGPLSAKLGDFVTKSTSR